MSDARLDLLADSARNRGLKLVRSRVRTPGKRGFGKVGLTDAAGKPVLGMDANGPSATPEEVEEYLRNLDAKDWGASLDVAVLPRKRKRARPALPVAANDREAVPEPAPPAKPRPELRDARPADAARIAELVRVLGHEIDEKAVRRNLAELKKAGESPLVATLANAVVGLCGINRRVAVHRPAPIGRISVLVVAPEARGQGIGRMLVEAAEQWFRKHGCALVEVTSNDRRAEAHAFYRRLGFERTSIRFAKAL